MANISKKKQLRGLELYNFLLRRLAEENKKQPKKLQLSIRRRREIVSKEIYPKLKAAGKYSLTQVSAELKGIVSKLPKEDVCNPNNLTKPQLGNFEFYAVDGYILGLPDCMYVRVNAGQYGITRIFSTRGYSYQSSGVSEIVEDIRLDALNNSGVSFFTPEVALKPNKAANIKIGENYFVDIVLNISGKRVQNVFPKNKKVQVENKPTPPIAKVEKDNKPTKQKKKKAFYKTAAIRKRDTVFERRAIIDRANSNIALLDKQFKMGILTKEQLKLFKTDVKESKNKELKNLP